MALGCSSCCSPISWPPWSASRGSPPSYRSICCGAALFVPGAHAFALTLAMTYGAVVIGLALRLRFGRRWALAAYLSAIVPSLIAVARVTPPHPGVVEALLLIFAVTAYGIALIERAPLAGLVAAAYAGLAAVVQPDAHALLPLALALAAVGIAVGRAAGWRWAWPAYAVVTGRRDDDGAAWACTRRNSRAGRCWRWRWSLIWSR